jgi:hypothetical protein
VLRAALLTRGHPAITPMIRPRITIGGIAGVHPVLTENGKTGSIQPQLIMPPTTSHQEFR